MTLERWIPRCSNVGFACQLPQPAPPKVKVRDNKKGGHPHGERLKTGGMADADYLRCASPWAILSTEFSSALEPALLVLVLPAGEPLPEALLP